MNVEQLLRGLAADDATTRVPPHVDAAVMAAWDESCRNGREAARRSRMVPWIAVATALVAILVAAVIVIRWPAGSEVHTAGNIASVKSSAAAVPDAGAAAIVLPREVERPVAPPRARRRPVAVSPAAAAAYVLVPDVSTDAPLTMMRVRMSRSAFSRLGVPIANPDGDGMVDVDVLVGEDGVARSIRRATAVGWVDANGQ